jgi:hypothetical protein
MNVDGSNVVPLNVSNVSRYNGNPRFSPKGECVFFLAGTEYNWGSRALYSLWKVGIGGENVSRIANKELFNDPLKWANRK